MGKAKVEKAFFGSRRVRLTDVIAGPVDVITSAVTYVGNSVKNPGATVVGLVGGDQITVSESRDNVSAMIWGS